LAPGSPMCQSFRISHGPGVPGFAVRIRALPPIPAPSPPSPPGENPVKTRRELREGRAKARFAPGVSRGGPGAASRDLEAPGPCPGTPPAFRGQNLVSAGSSCPLKPGWIREAPGGSGPSAGSWIGEGRVRRRRILAGDGKRLPHRGRLPPDPGSANFRLPGILLLNFGLSEIPFAPSPYGRVPGADRGRGSSGPPARDPFRIRSPRSLSAGRLLGGRREAGAIPLPPKSPGRWPARRPAISAKPGLPPDRTYAVFCVAYSGRGLGF
jgi:hypothetical protein